MVDDRGDVIGEGDYRIRRSCGVPIKSSSSARKVLQGKINDGRVYHI